jgi:hypothetical protein
MLPPANGRSGVELCRSCNPNTRAEFYIRYGLRGVSPLRTLPLPVNLTEDSRAVPNSPPKCSALKRYVNIEMAFCPAPEV